MGPGSYKVTLTVTDNDGCSTRRLFTGQTMSCNGSNAARVTQTVTVPGAALCAGSKATLGGRSGADRIAGTPRANVIDCRPGHDVAIVDAVDRTRHCEVFIRAPRRS